MIIKKCSAVLDPEVESGNVGSFKKVNYGHFEFRARLDKSPYALWFYFKLRNVNNRKIILDLLNTNEFMIQKESWPRFNPVFSYNLKEWNRFQKGEVFYNNENKIFSMSTTFKSNIVYIASSFPYTFSDLNNFLTSKKNNPFLKISNIGNSGKGNEIKLLTIGNEDVSNNFKILITLRHHAMEASASFVLEGLIKYLLSDSKEALWLRENCIFKIIPMVNVDSILKGEFGKDSSPIDLNLDYYENPYHKEIKIIQSFILNWQKSKNIDFFIDFHCPEIDETHYIPFPGGNYLPSEYRKYLISFAKFLEFNSNGMFMAKDCCEPYWVDIDLLELSSGDVFWSEPIKTFSITPEISYRCNSKGDFTTLKSLRNLGRAYGKSLYMFFNKYGGNEIIKKNLTYESFTINSDNNEFSKWRYWNSDFKNCFLLKKENGLNILRIVFKKERNITFITNEYTIIEKNKVRFKLEMKSEPYNNNSKVTVKILPRFYGKNKRVLRVNTDNFFVKEIFLNWGDAILLTNIPNNAVMVRLLFEITGEDIELHLKPIRIL